MAQLPAFAVNEGRVPAEMLRRELWATSKGVSGIVTARDLKVTALPTPGPAVRVAAGGAICATRTTGAHAQESYMLAQDSVATVPVSATGTFYLIARIDDWHFTGNPAPDDKANALYWSFATVSTLDGINYPYVPLARITRGSATNITNAMIRDLRVVVAPRKDRTLFAYNLTQADGPQHLISQTPQYWPDLPALDDWTVYVPEWAHSAQIVAAVNGVRCVPDSEKWGVIYVRLGSAEGWGQGNVETQHQRWDLGGSATGREHWEIADDVLVPEALRGTTQRLRIIASRRDNLSGSGPFLDSSSSIKYDIEFHERAI